MWFLPTTNGSPALLWAQPWSMRWPIWIWHILKLTRANSKSSQLRRTNSCRSNSLTMTPSGNRWWQRAIPAATWLSDYRRASLRFDLLAGITLAAYLLPAALGDASLANLPPQAGLYACLLGGLVFWLFCSSRHTVISVT